MTDIVNYCQWGLGLKRLTAYITGQFNDSVISLLRQKIIMIGQYLITASSCNKVIFIANCNVGNLSFMSSQSGKKSAIFTRPDFNQFVISTLQDNPNINKFLSLLAASFVITKWRSLRSTIHELSLAEKQVKWRILFSQARRITSSLWGIFTNYRNFLSFTRTADYLHRPIIAYGEKKSQ